MLILCAVAFVNPFQVQRNNQQSTGVNAVQLPPIIIRCCCMQLTQRNTRRPKFLDVRLSFPLVSSPNTLKTRSAYVSGAGALWRSNANGDNFGNLGAFVSKKLMMSKNTGAAGFKCDWLHVLHQFFFKHEQQVIYLFHNSRYMQKTQIIKSKNNITCKLRNIT